MDVRTFVLEEKHRESLQQLLHELSGVTRELHMEAHPNVHCVGAFSGDQLIGFAQLFVLRKTTRTIGHVEDVVVSDLFRGAGLGRKIMDKIIAVARAERCDTLSLTSEPVRKAAHALYRSLGFQVRDTTVFRLTL